MPAIENTNTARAAQLVEFGWSDYQRGLLGRVVDTLPGLIETAQQLEDAAPHPTNDSRACWSVSARTYHLAATTLSKIDEADLAWIAAERAMHTADQADDPLVLASAARAGTHALLAVGRFEDALSRYGMLHLRTAVAAARHQDRTTAVELLNRAHCAAEQLGEDVEYVIDRGPGVNVDHLPTERGVSHLIDLARALLSAERAAPQLVRHNPVVRETVKSMHRRAPVTGGSKSSALLGLAERCRAIQ